jgi:alkyldihydroxyacetonephosphate synthase
VFARQDADDPAGQWTAAKRAASDAIAAAGATITHHHAVGRDHVPWLEAEDGALGIDLLRAVKRRCDPAGVMNPGKLLPG